MDAIFQRRSIREFDLERKIDDDTLIHLCKAASSAPSAKKQDGKRYIIINNQEIINELSKIPHGTLDPKNCNTFIAIVGTNPENLKIAQMQAIDLSCAAENILIEATSLSLGSCFLGVYPLFERMSEVGFILGVDAPEFVFALIALGYPKNKDDLKELDKFNPKSITFNRG